MAVLACPTCNTATSTRPTRAGDVALCGNCGLTFCDTDDTIVATPHDFFDADLPAQEAAARRMVEGRMRAYERILGRPVESVIEVGCGTGAWARAWQEQGCTWTGVEFLPELAEQTRQRTGATVVTGDFITVADLPKADVLFCSQVLEHVAAPIPFLRRAREVADLIHIDVPNQRSVTATARRLLGSKDYGFIQVPHHLRAYSAPSLAYAMTAAGFQVRDCRGIANDDATFGQLFAGRSIRQRLAYRTASAIGRGSLLMAIGA